MPLTQRYEEKFWSRVSIPAAVLDGCWAWTGATTSTGYGHFMFGRRAHKAHRLAWEVFVGTPAGSSLVCHRCDNRLCVNPTHLFLGTHADNTADMLQKRRHRCQQGEKHTSAKLRAADVLLIRDLLAAGRSMASLARDFGVSGPTIRLIREARTWKGV